MNTLPDTTVSPCIYCGRFIKVEPSDEHRKGVLAGHVNGKTNRYCKGAGEPPVYDIYTKSPD